jgi:uncharacterized protein (DUF305 family)
MKMALTLIGLVFLTSCGGAGNRTADIDRVSNSPSNLNSANSSSVDHSTMDHSAIKSSPGAASAPRELQFLDTMIVHHQAAVDMAMLAETRAQRAELKELAANIVSDQEREIAKMSEWREAWFEGKPESINLEFPGMAKGMSGMDMKKLDSLKGSEFDIEFVRQMIPHHEGAVEMAKAIKGGDGRAELKELADDIITAQEAEIKKMREWLNAWQGH